LDKLAATMSVPVNAYHVGWQLVAWHTALLAHYIGTDGWVLPQSQGPLMPTEFCNLYLYLYLYQPMSGTMEFRNQS
jgi:hypothetical protein